MSLNEIIEHSAGSETASRLASVLSAGGAVLGALFSSACCWLPLALVAFGASAAGVAGVFEVYRLPLLVVTVGLLGSGFYFTYRAPKCQPGDACAVPNLRIQKMNKILLWTAAVFVVLFAAFPNYIGFLLG